MEKFGGSVAKDRKRQSSKQLRNRQTKNEAAPPHTPPRILAEVDLCMARTGLIPFLTLNNIICLKVDVLKSRHWQWAVMNPTGPIS